MPGAHLEAPAADLAGHAADHRAEQRSLARLAALRRQAALVLRAPYPGRVMPFHIQDPRIDGVALVRRHRHAFHGPVRVSEEAEAWLRPRW